jgi:hypothetical protein
MEFDLQPLNTRPRREDILQRCRIAGIPATPTDCSLRRQGADRERRRHGHRVPRGKSIGDLPNEAVKG